MCPSGGPPRFPPKAPSGIEVMSAGDATRAFLEALRPRLGTAAFRALEPKTFEAQQWARKHWDPEKGSLARFVWSVVGKAYSQLVKEVSIRLLTLEWIDERMLRAASTGGEHEVETWLGWTKAEVRRQRRVFPRQWRVAGLDAEDVDGEIAVELLVRLRRQTSAGDEAWPPHQPGEARSLRVAELVRRRLQKRRCFTIALPPADMVTLAERRRDEMRRPGPEAQLLSAERHRAAAEFAKRAPALLSDIQNNWFEGFRGAVEKTSADVNVSAIAAALNKSPSAGSKMRSAIRDRLAPLVDELELREREDE